MAAKSTSESTNPSFHTRFHSSFHYGNPMLDCHGAQLRKQCRQLATVLTVIGTIDQTNVDIVLQQAKGCVIPEKPVIVDLSGVTSFAAPGIALLDAVDKACTGTGEEWMLIASPQVVRTLRLCGIDGCYPYGASIPDALHHFSDAAGERRRLLPILTKSA